MPSLARAAAWILCTLMLLAFLAPQGRALPQEVQPVQVTNFPDPQKISGVVTVDGTVRHALFQRFPETLVQPVEPSNTRHLVPGGTLVTDGFTSVAISLGGQLKLKAFKPGSIGALLIPEEEAVLRAFEEDGKLLFPLEVRADSGTASPPYFASTQGPLPVAFPRYRIFYYNTSDRTAAVILYAYLTH